MTYQQHPLSAAFPAMAADDFQALKDSIEILGVQNAITLYEGMVLDGWHRYSAAQALGMPCPERELPAGMDPVDFVRAQNKERRHLPAGAWALIEAELWGWRPVGKPAAPSSAPGAELQAAGGEAPNSLPGRELPQKTAAEMAAAAGVSVATIERAKKVQRDAVPEVQAAVKSGGVSLKDAVAVSSLPQEEQAALAAAGPAAIKEAARKKAPVATKTAAKEARRHALEVAMGLPQSPLCFASRMFLDAVDSLGEGGPNEDEYRYLRQVCDKCRPFVDDDTDTQIEALHAENDRLERENAELRIAADPALAERLRAAEEKLHAVEVVRNDLMQTNDRLNDENKRLKRATNGGRARG